MLESVSEPPCVRVGVGWSKRTWAPACKEFSFLLLPGIESQGGACRGDPKRLGSC